MRKYYLINDTTTSEIGKTRLVDNKRWLESKYVKLLEVIEAQCYEDAKKQVISEGIYIW